MVRRQPGLLSLSVTGNVLEKIEFFTEEMGLRNDQIAKMICAHPQASVASREKNPVQGALGVTSQCGDIEAFGLGGSQRAASY